MKYKKIKELTERANIHYKKSLDELYKVGDVLEEIRKVNEGLREERLEKVIMDGTEFMRKEGYVRYEKGRFEK